MPKPLAKASWPGWFTDQQLAGEFAQSLARQLSASVNAGQLAAAWLALHGTDTTQPASAMDDVAKARKRRRRRKRRAPVQQQPAQNPPPQPVTSPRQFLTAQGVIASITAIVASVLAQLWGAALTMGWASAVMVLGIGEIKGAEQALARLLAAGQGRIAGIVQTRVSRLERVLLDALRSGISVDELAQQIRDILGSLTSALLVTQTETTWASSWAAYWAYRLAGIKWVRWRSRRDGRTCFPAGTLIATPDGCAPIERLRPGDLVVTPQGSRPVRAAAARAYTGGTTTIDVEGTSVTATDDHLFATPDGWRKAGDLKSGDFLKSLEDKLLRIASVHKLRFGEADNVPSPLRQIFISDDVPFLAELMPVLSVSLHDDTDVGQCEVHGPAPDVNFLIKGNVQKSECCTDAELQHRFASEPAVATAGAEPADGSRRRDHSEICAAVGTSYIDGRPAALLGTEVPVKALRVGIGETLTASFAVDVDGRGRLAGDRTDPIAMCDGYVDSELLTADGADPSDPGDARQLAFASAVSAILPTRPLTGVEHFFAAHAFAFRIDDGCGMVALSRTVGMREPGTDSAHELCAAVVADTREGHGVLRSENAPSGSLTVYDIEVETEHVFYANGVLVHNCKICLANDYQGPVRLGRRFLSGLKRPPQHPRCRCSLLPAANPKSQSSTSQTGGGLAHA